MITLGLSTWSVRRWLDAAPGRLLELPAALRTHGLTSLQIVNFQMPSTDDAYLRDLRAALDASGVTLDALLIDTGDLAQADRDEDDGGDDERDAARWMEIARTLGARYARVAAGDQPPTADALARSAERMLRLAARGKSLGVRVVTENWRSLLPDADAVLRYREIAGGRLPLCIDFGNWRGPDKYDQLAAIAPHAVTCHAKCCFDGPTPDADDFARCCRLLRDAGYAGTLALIYDGAVDDEWAMIAVERDLARAAFA